MALGEQAHEETNDGLDTSFGEARQRRLQRQVGGRVCARLARTQVTARSKSPARANANNHDTSTSSSSHHNHQNIAKRQRRPTSGTMRAVRGSRWAAKVARGSQSCKSIYMFAPSLQIAPTKRNLRVALSIEGRHRSGGGGGGVLLALPVLLFIVLVSVADLRRPFGQFGAIVSALALALLRRASRSCSSRVGEPSDRLALR